MATRRSSATRSGTPAGTVVPGRAPGATGVFCARHATAIVNQTMHPRISDFFQSVVLRIWAYRSSVCRKELSNVNAPKPHAPGGRRGQELVRPVGGQRVNLLLRYRNEILKRPVEGRIAEPTTGDENRGLGRWRIEHQGGASAK